MDKYNILDFIPFGQENAVPMSELAHRMNSSERTARKLVFNARINGDVICSTCYGDRSDGYYRPVSAEEAFPYVRMQRERIASAVAALRSAENFVSEGGDKLAQR